MAKMCSRKQAPCVQGSEPQEAVKSLLAAAAQSQLRAGWPGGLGFWGWLGPMYWRGTWVGAVIRSVPR